MTMPIVARTLSGFLAALCLLGVVSVTACSESREEQAHADEAKHEAGLVVLGPEQLASIKIATARAEYRPFAPQLTTTGQVGYEEDRLAHVSPRIPGRVVRVSARLGDEVKPGEGLAVIDSVELGQAKAAYLVARTREQLATENHERETTLYDQRISSQKEMLEARARHLEASSERQSAEEALRLYGLNDSEIAPLRPGDPSASLLTVRASISGRVVEKHVAVGELVTPERNLFTIADLQHVWIWIDVFERDIASVHLGDEVEVRVDAYPVRVFTGKVTYVGSQVASGSRTLRARIDVVNSEGLLRPGMFAAVKLTDPHGEKAANTLVVPAAAVVGRGDEALVFVPGGGGRFVAHPVKTGRQEGEFVEVLSGLEAGEEVVTQGTFFLKSELARGELGGGHQH